jgi:hypothetical protein
VRGKDCIQNREFVCVFIVLLPGRCIRGYGSPWSTQKDVCLYYITIIQRVFVSSVSFLIGFLGLGLRSFFFFFFLFSSANLLLFCPGLSESMPSCYSLVKLYTLSLNDDCRFVHLLVFGWDG